MPEADLFPFHFANEGDVRVDVDKLHDLGVRALVAAGVPEDLSLIHI